MLQLAAAACRKMAAIGGDMVWPQRERAIRFENIPRRGQRDIAAIRRRAFAFRRDANDEPGQARLFGLSCDTSRTAPREALVVIAA